MNPGILLMSCALATVLQLQAQNVKEIFGSKGEVFAAIARPSQIQVAKMSEVVSIDKIKADSLYFYANQDEFARFLDRLGLPFNILPSPGDVADVDMFRSTSKETFSWDQYPSYAVYMSMMSGFAAAYPGLCRLDTLATLSSGRSLVAAIISDHVRTTEYEPKFLYTSSMHGDELTGYVLLLRLINHLLANYGTDSLVTRLINNVEIWINPLANPDGAFTNDDNTITGATRGNAKYIDLNRNYQSPAYGLHPDGNAWQEETIAFMRLAEEQHFTLSANLHGGAEVMNYPWDVWSRRHADDAWWYSICRQYADTVQHWAQPGFFDDLQNGITNGYDWYMVNGSRQDYMNYFQQTKELTIELTSAKIPSGIVLPNIWEYHYRSMLRLIEQSLFGLKGIVTDSVTGLPLKARIDLAGHDKDSSHVYARLPLGHYYRPLSVGTYDLLITAPGYHQKTISAIAVFSDSATEVNVQLSPTITNSSDHPVSQNTGFKIFPNPANGNICLPPSIPQGSTWILYNGIGAVISSGKVLGSQLSLTELPGGIYTLCFPSLHIKQSVLLK